MTPEHMDVFMLERREARPVFRNNFHPFRLQIFQCRLQVNRIPEHHSIRDKPQGAELVFLAFAIRLADFSPFTVADRPGDLVASLPPVQLGQNATTVMGFQEQLAVILR